MLESGGDLGMSYKWSASAILEITQLSFGYVSRVSTYFFFVNYGRTKVRSILLLFKQKMHVSNTRQWSIFEVLWQCFEKKYLQKASDQNMLSTYRFSLDTALPQVFNKAKDKKKSHIHTCMSLDINLYWWWHVLALHILYCCKYCVKQFTGTFGSIVCVLNCHPR